MHFSENEYKVMELVWEYTGGSKSHYISALELSDLLTEKYGWPKTSNYSYFHRLIKKGALDRTFPIYNIKAAIFMEDVKYYQLKKILDNNFDGSLHELVECWLKNNKYTQKDITDLILLIDRYR